MLDKDNGKSLRWINGGLARSARINEVIYEYFWITVGYAAHVSSRTFRRPFFPRPPFRIIMLPAAAFEDKGSSIRGGPLNADLRSFLSLATCLKINCRRFLSYLQRNNFSLLSGLLDDSGDNRGARVKWVHIVYRCRSFCTCTFRWNLKRLSNCKHIDVRELLLEY